VRVEMLAKRAKPAGLVIADDHDLMRSGLRALLTDVPNLQVLGEAANGREALELCRRFEPDLVLMDVRMPEMDGLTATRAIKHRYPRTSVLVLTVHENQSYMLEALKAGAAGYILKDAPRKELLGAIGRVLEGEVTLSRRLSLQLLMELANGVGGAPGVAGFPESETPYSLTPRELEVLRMLALGYGNQKIAENLVIAVGTVKNHVQHILAKLGVSDRTQAVVRAYEAKIVKPPSR
jgi:DNA-binding NarL/FixJ family response regulator